MNRCFHAVLATILLAPLGALAQGTYGLEFSAGLLGQIERDATGAGADKKDLAPTWGISPWMEFPLGKGGIGPEVNFNWLKRSDAKDSDERRLIISPHLRLRMSFPIVKKVTFDGFISLGPSWWTSTELAEDDPVEGHRFGWGVRFGFGGAYALNRTVSFFAHVGYQNTSSYGDAMVHSADSIPIAFGLRAAQ